MAQPEFQSFEDFWPFYVRWMFGVPVPAYLFSTWIRPALAIAPFALCTVAFERFLPATNLRAFFAEVFVLLPLALAGAWRMVVAPAERARILREHVRPILVRVRARAVA